MPEIDRDLAVVVFFATLIAIIALAIDCANGAVEHAVCGLQPQQPVQVLLDGIPQLEATPDTGGVILFALGGPGAVTVTRAPEPSPTSLLLPPTSIDASQLAWYRTRCLGAIPQLFCGTMEWLEWGVVPGPLPRGTRAELPLTPGEWAYHVVVYPQVMPAMQDSTRCLWWAETYTIFTGWRW